MNIKEIHRNFSFARLALLLLFFSAGLQLIIVSQLYLYGTASFAGPAELLGRFFRGVFLTFLAGLMLAYPFLLLIRRLNRTLPWSGHALKRFFLQFLLAAAAGLLITPVIFYPAVLIFDVASDFTMLLNNAYYFVFLSLFLMVGLEAQLYFEEGTGAKRKAKNLEKELTQIRFEVLKNQINPHFMFNSLNVLSGLISVDTAKAQLFIDEFSQIYRYVLETIEQPVVLLEQELEFMRSYLFLQQIRYGEALTSAVNIPSGLLPMALPPLSLQLVLENAIKHNIVNDAKPLKIEVFSEGSFLVVRNNLQPKMSGKSLGVGLKNFVKRYALVSEREPSFSIIDSYFVAKLPLIPVDSDESTDH